MIKRNSVVVGVALVALLVAGGLFASNMGFKLNYVLEAQGTNGSANGNNTLALPFNQQTSLTTASDLFADIGGLGVVASVSSFNRSDDTLSTYNGVVAANNFTVTPGDGIQVKVLSDVNYIVVGSHDPGLVVNFDAQGTNGSANGNNQYAVPYHTTVTDTAELFAEIEAAGGPGSVVSVSTFNRSDDTLATYNGVVSTNILPIVPGKSYTIKVASDIAYVPSHY